MNTKRKFFAVVFLSSLLVAVVFGKETPEVEPPGKIKARIAAAEKAKLVLSEDGRTVTGVKDRERKTFTIPQGVTAIGAEAFAECPNLRKVTIPDTVEVIGPAAFKNNLALKSVSLPKSVKRIGRAAFQKCGIKRIEVPEGVTVIDSLTFYDCPELERVTLPATVTEIRSRAFWASPHIKEITLPEGLTTLGRDSIYGVAIKVSPKNPHFYIDGKGVLFDRRENKLIVAPRSLTRRYAIPEDITSIEYGAFQFCGRNMNNIIVHKGVTMIGDGAFVGSEAVEIAPGNPYFYLDDRGLLIDKIQKKLLFAPRDLAGEYNVAEDMLAIGGRTFQNCRDLFRVKLPDGLQKIGPSAFAGCVNLRRITLPDSITHIGSSAFLRCGKMENVPLPENLQSVESDLFASCSNITEIKISPNVKYIGKRAFSGTGIRSMVIPDHVKRLEFSAFYACKNLRQVSVPKHIPEKTLKPRDVPATCKVVWRKE